MADKRWTFKKLRKALKRYGCVEDKALGKGSHTTFCRKIENGVATYPIPTHEKEVAKCYVEGVRKRLQLTDADGVPDDEFYA